tara:strand:+ start:1156 stop:2226 length:1071 start_codon:yes stop_codon:yes gene_type:complete
MTPIPFLPMSGMAPVFNVDGSNPSNIYQDQEGSGLGGGVADEPTGQYIAADVERVITPRGLEGKRGVGCAIILGKDRVHSKWTGKGGDGDTQAWAIRMVAGFGGCNPGIKGAHGYWPDVDEEGKPTMFNPSFKYDSAQIYLAQKTDCDTNLYLAHGSLGAKFDGKSAAIMKADAVRLISRDGGIKLVANTDKHSSGGKPIKGVSTIDFIVNNDDEALQPLVKGDNLVVFLKALDKNLRELVKQTSSIMKSQLKLNGIIATHTHPLPPSAQVIDPFTGMPMPASAAPGYGVSEFTLPPTSVKSSPNLNVAVVDHAKTCSGLIETYLVTMNHNLSGWVSDYLKNSGPKHILSENVNTT